MSRRFQFSLKWLFVAMLAAACFFAGIRYERARLKTVKDFLAQPRPAELEAEIAELEAKLEQ